MYWNDETYTETLKRELNNIRQKCKYRYIIICRDASALESVYDEELTNADGNHDFILGYERGSEIINMSLINSRENFIVGLKASVLKEGVVLDLHAFSRDVVYIDLSVSPSFDWMLFSLGVAKRFCTFVWSMSMSIAVERTIRAILRARR